MRQAFLAIIVALFLNSEVLLSQQPRTSSNVKFETVEDFVSDQGLVRSEKLKFYKSSDPNSRYSLDMHQALWDNNIKIILPYRHVGPQQETRGVLASFKIDAFGLSTTNLMHEEHPELATDLMKKIRGEVVGKNIDYNDLYDLVLELKRELDAVWARSKNEEYDSLILRAGLTNHTSKVSNKRECWLLVEVFHAKRFSHDLFVRDFMDQVLRVKINIAERYKTNPMEGQTYTNLHPMVQESRFLEKNRRLQPNRNQAKVIVRDDLLTIAEREATFGFRVIDNTEKKYHQVEGSSWPDVDNRRASEALSYASELLSDRVPKGTYLSFEELHLCVGSVANNLQSRFPEYKLIITIKESKLNNAVYATLYLDVELLD